MVIFKLFINSKVENKILGFLKKKKKKKKKKKMLPIGKHGKLLMGRYGAKVVEEKA